LSEALGLCETECVRILEMVVAAWSLSVSEAMTKGVSNRCKSNTSRAIVE
jgi:hypothetical protein